MNTLSAIVGYAALIPVTRVRYIGIYFLIAADEVIYVGQSADVEVRVNAHIDAGKLFDRACWITVPAEALDAHEGAFIRLLDSRFNFAAPADFGRDFEVLARFGLAPDSEARDRFNKRRTEQWGAGANRKGGPRKPRRVRLAEEKVS